MPKIVINRTVTDTWTDEEVLDHLQKQIPNFGHTKGKIQDMEITLNVKRQVKAIKITNKS